MRLPSPAVARARVAVKRRLRVAGVAVPSGASTQELIAWGRVAFVIGAFYKAGVRDDASGALWDRYLVKLREVLPRVTEHEAQVLLDARRSGGATSGLDFSVRLPLLSARGA